MDEQQLAALKARIAAAVAAKQTEQPKPKIRPQNMRGQVIGDYGHATAVLAVERRNVAPDWVSLSDDEYVAKAVEIAFDPLTTVEEVGDFKVYVAPDGHRFNTDAKPNGDRKFWMCMDTVGHEWKCLDHLREQLDTMLKGEQA